MTRETYSSRLGLRNIIPNTISFLLSSERIQTPPVKVLHIEQDPSFDRQAAAAAQCFVLLKAPVRSNATLPHGALALNGSRHACEEGRRSNRKNKNSHTAPVVVLAGIIMKEVRKQIHSISEARRTRVHKILFGLVVRDGILVEYVQYDNIWMVELILNESLRNSDCLNNGSRLMFELGIEPECVH